MLKLRCLPGNALATTGKVRLPMAGS